MEDSQSKQEPEPSTGDALLDTVDHERLARLVAPGKASRADKEQQLSGGFKLPMSMPTIPEQRPPVVFSQHAPPMAAPSAPVPYAGAQKKSSPVLILAAITSFLLILIAGLLGIFFLRSMKTASVPVRQPVKQSPPESNAPIKPDLVSLPGGSFQMGRSDGAEQEGPVHSVTVGAFSIDRTEVTNAEYAQFVAETGHAPPRQFVAGRPLSGQEQWPVTNVSLEDAKAFAA